jgi:hypothetical protein
VHIQRIIRNFKTSLHYDELLSGAHVGVTSDVSIHDESIVDDNKSTSDENTTANEHSNGFNEANKSTIDDNTTAIEHLNFTEETKAQLMKTQQPAST